MDRTRGPDDLLSLEPVGRSRVLLDGEGVAPQPDHELPGLTGKHGGRKERGDEEAARCTAHICFLSWLVNPNRFYFVVLRNLVHHVHSLRDLSENGVDAVKMRLR